jgi:hypothetical protein
MEQAIDNGREGNYLSKISVLNASMQSDCAVLKLLGYEPSKTLPLDSIDPLQAKNHFASRKQGKSILLGKF